MYRPRAPCQLIHLVVSGLSNREEGELIHFRRSVEGRKPDYARNQTPSFARLTNIRGIPGYPDAPDSSRQPLRQGRIMTPCVGQRTHHGSPNTPLIVSRLRVPGCSRRSPSLSVNLAP